MKKLIFFFFVSAAVLLASCSPWHDVRFRSAEYTIINAVVTDIHDGDTITVKPLASVPYMDSFQESENVRLLFIDTPETSPNDRFFRQISRLHREGAYWKEADWLAMGTNAGDYIKNLCPVGSSVTLDLKSKRLRDIYGRLLAVVFLGNTNVNLMMVYHGLAETYFVSDGTTSESDRLYKQAFLSAASMAQARKAGIWRIDRRAP